MLFNSSIFITAFLPACLAGFFVLGQLAGSRWALGWLVAASLFFYGWWNPPFVLLLIGSILVNYTVGQKILHQRLQAPHTARWWLRIGVTMNLGLLGWFKYANFFADNLRLISGMDLALPHVFLPLAISFFTFQQIMFLVDSSRGVRQDLGFLPYAGFVAFFPHLIAGPIVRPCEIIPQFTAPDLARPRLNNLGDGLALFVLGLAKKLLLADHIAPIVNRGFDAVAMGDHLTCIEAWLAVLAYALQIYFDFSGYSDMAIGLARMLNIRFPLNFDSPYQSLDISAFWRRWHITLGQFLRDDVYIVLGGNRAGPWRRDANLMITMLLGGLWHGAAWTFVLWGALHGAYLVAHARLRAFFHRQQPAQHTTQPPPRHRVAQAMAQGLTLLAVLVAWVPFRAADLHSTGAIWRNMIGLNGVVIPPVLAHYLTPFCTGITGGYALPILGAGQPHAFGMIGLWLGALSAVALFAPNLHRMTHLQRCGLVALSFAPTMQALFLAPNASPFLYFQF